MDDAARRQLAAAKDASTLQRLFRVARRVDEVARARVSAQSGMALRPAHTQLLPHIDLDGTRPTEIARRLGVTKQAVAPAIDELVAWGLLEKVADPEDGRAVLVRFRGVEGLLHGLSALGALEGEVADAIGAARLDALRDALGGIEAWLDARDQSAAQPRGPS